MSSNDPRVMRELEKLWARNEATAETADRVSVVFDLGDPVDSARRLRAMLKAALRVYGMRAVSVTPCKPNHPEAKE